MAYLRFAVPEFDYAEFMGMDWSPPALKSADEAAAMAEARAGGDDADLGCHPVALPDDFVAAYDLRGEFVHGLLCLLPDDGAHILGRSQGWYTQRALVVDSLDAGSDTAVIDWKTPRPVNVRLGPEDGVNIPNTAIYVVTAHGFADYWIGNRTIVDSGWTGDDGSQGFRVLSSALDDRNDFYDCNLTISWPA
jgi:hypothetical protein